MLGIECDHISGQTVNQENGYKDMAIEYLASRGITATPATADNEMYKLAEMLWMTEYRAKGFIPYQV